jgi:hypothetical protein
VRHRLRRWRCCNAKDDDVSIQTSRLFAFRHERSGVAECREIDFGTVPKYRFVVAEFH